MDFNNKFPDEIIDVLSIDCVIFGFKESKLHILLVQHGEGISKGKWGLPGGWVMYNESIDVAAERLLKGLTGLQNLYLEQLPVFSNPKRYPDKRVITVPYVALIQAEAHEILYGDTASDAQWFEIDKHPELIYDHADILKCGFEHLQHKVRYQPIGFNLLPAEFTLLQLQSLYEAILETKLDKPNFRRKILKMNLLIDARKKQSKVSHRAANLYRFDEQVYQKLKEKGFIFEY